MGKPTILFITTDEQHRGTLSCLGKSACHTAAIDDLARQGDVYQWAYTASPVCLPARCTWMTGLYPHNSRCVSNHYGASLSRNHPNLFTELKKQGYATSLHGKCHFVPVPYDTTRPDRTLEYEHVITYYRSLGMDTLNLQDDKNVSLWFYDDYSKELEEQNLLKPYRDRFHGEKKDVSVFTGPDRMHPDAWVGEETLEYIEHCDRSTAQFIWTSFSGPHYPIDPPQRYLDKVDLSEDQRVFAEDEWQDTTKYHANGYFGPGTTEGSANAPGKAQKNYDEAYWRNWRRHYYANICLIDEYVGKIVEKAKEKWGEQLYIVFTTDHGEMMGNHSLWGKNGALFEDVLHIPLIIHKPGQRQRRDMLEPVSSVDVFPTLLGYAGAPIPRRCDGRPLEKVCEQGGRDYILSQCDNRIALIKDGIKLEWNRYADQGMYYELYDLNLDPDEFVNRYGDERYAGRRQEMENILRGLEEREKILSVDFYDPAAAGAGKPYWFVR